MERGRRATYKIESLNHSLSQLLSPSPLSSLPSILLSRVGDILESMNGVNLSNGDHREAVRAVKVSKEVLGIVSQESTQH